MEGKDFYFFKKTAISLVCRYIEYAFIFFEQMSYVKHTDKNLHAVVKWQSSKTELNIANTEKALRCLSPKEGNGFI